VSVSYEATFVVSAVGELGALAAVAVRLGFLARLRSASGTIDHRSGTRGLVLGIIVLAFVVVPNVVAAFVM